MPRSSGVDDLELFSLLSDGNGLQLFDGMREWVSDLICRSFGLLPDTVAAEDVLLKIEDRWPSVLANFDADGAVSPADVAARFRAYVKQVVKNTSIELFRSPKWRSRRTLEHPDAVRSPTHPLYGFSEDDLCELREIVDSLPEEDRELIFLKFYEDLTFEEIARSQGRSLSSTYRQMRDIIDHLRHRLS